MVLLYQSFFLIRLEIKRTNLKETQERPLFRGLASSSLVSEFPLTLQHLLFQFQLILLLLSMALWLMLTWSHLESANPVSSEKLQAETLLKAIITPALFPKKPKQ